MTKDLPYKDKMSEEEKKAVKKDPNLTKMQKIEKIYGPDKAWDGGDWCHKFTPEGIIVRPHCTHNLSNEIKPEVV